MAKRIFFISLILIVLTGLYLLVSMILLNGKITYRTSFNESTIANSKREKLFITDQLPVKTEGDSLADWQNMFELWTNKRSEVKYFGFIFHWTYNEASWRYLNIEPKNKHTRDKWFRKKLTVNGQVTDYIKNFSGGWEPCCNYIGCNQNDTIRIEFTDALQKEKKLGAITIIVK